MLKKTKKTYYGKILLQTTQTYYFKRLWRYPKYFCKFFRISNALKQQRFSHKLKASAKVLKRTSLANIISYPMKPFSSSTLFLKVIKIIHKHDRLLRYATLFGNFFRISNALKQQRFSHQVKASAKIFKQTSLANIINYPIPEMSGLSYFAVQIQSWIFKTQSKSNHSPKKFKKFKLLVQRKCKKLTNTRF